MEKVITRYEIHDTFKITGRGIVFLGILIGDGFFKTGDYLKFNFKDEILIRKIKGLDSGMRLIKGINYFGIMIETKDENEISELRNWNPEKTLAEIFSSDIG